VDEFGRLAVREREAKRIARRQWFWLHLAVFVPSQVFVLIMWSLGSSTYPWYVFPLFGWGILLMAHGVFAFVMRHPDEILMQRAGLRSQGSDLTPDT
jgi:hypothetical protein